MDYIFVDSHNPAISTKLNGPFNTLAEIESKLNEEFKNKHFRLWPEEGIASLIESTDSGVVAGYPVIITGKEENRIATVIGS